MAENNRVTEQKDRQRQKDEKNVTQNIKIKLNIQKRTEEVRKIKSKTTSEQNEEKLMIRFFMHRVI